MIHREVTFPVSPEQLWEQLTEPSSVSSWFGAQVEWELAPGGDARFRGGDDGDRCGRVDTVEPERQLRFTWWPQSDISQASEVTYRLEPTEEGTRLTITEARAADQAWSRGTRTARDPSTLETLECTTLEITALEITALDWSALDWSARDCSAWDLRMIGAWCRTSAIATAAA